MDKEAFLKLLIAQIKNQDPLKPMEGTEFVAQLSQFAVVEQAISQSKQLENVSTQLSSMAENQATSLVGKSVSVRGKPIEFGGVMATTSAVSLDAPATKVTADIVDSNGRVVRSINVGSRPAGAMSVMWDGHDNAGQMQPQGTYTLRVAATGADGKPVGTTQDVAGLVTSVSFDKGYPEITLDNGATFAMSDLSSVKLDK